LGFRQNLDLRVDFSVSRETEKKKVLVKLPLKDEDWSKNCACLRKFDEIHYFLRKNWRQNRQDGARRVSHETFNPCAGCCRAAARYWQGLRSDNASETRHQEVCFWAPYFKKTPRSLWLCEKTQGGAKNMQKMCLKPPQKTKAHSGAVGLLLGGVRGWVG